MLCVSLKNTQYKPLRPVSKTNNQEKKKTEVDLQMTQMLEKTCIKSLTTLNTDPINFTYKTILKAKSLRENLGVYLGSRTVVV